VVLLGALIRNTALSGPPPPAAIEPVPRGTASAAPAVPPAPAMLRPPGDPDSPDATEPSSSSSSSTSKCSFPRGELDECLYFQLTAYRADACRSCVEAAWEGALSRREPRVYDDPFDDDEEKEKGAGTGRPGCSLPGQLR
jgi:hypothetical protein